MTRAIVKKTGIAAAYDQPSALTIIPRPMNRRVFCQWGAGLAAGALILPACSNNAEELLGKKTAALGATDGPIYRKWIKLGGEAAVGAATSDPIATPNGGQYQTFSGGVIVYSADYGAVFVSTAIFNEWLLLNGQSTPDGQNLLAYVGFPTEDLISTAGLDTVHFERGMIVLSGGVATLVYGFIYEHYFHLSVPLGLPTAPQAFAPSGGLFQTFQGGDIYWKADTGAAFVQGPIAARWSALGGAGGALGFPIADQQAVVADAVGTVIGASSRFEHGVIFFSELSGAWEVTGAIRDYYEQQLGGANAPNTPTANAFGFPVGSPQTTATGVVQDFQGGVVVSNSSGAMMGTFAFGKLQLFVNRVTGAPEDCIPVIDDCFDPDLYYFVTVATSEGLSFTVRRPPSGSFGGQTDPRETFALSNVVRSNLSVDITIDMWDSETGEDDEHLGKVSVTYNLANLWGLFDGGNHSNTIDGNGATVDFSIKNPLPFDPNKFRQNLCWSFQNFTTDPLTYDQFAATFTDVSPDEHFWTDPFDAAFFAVAYKHLAKNGNCFGMCLESIFAQVGASLFAEPVIRYWPDTQAGQELDPNQPNEQQTINEINVKHGYQIGAEAIDWFLGRLIIGQTHDPKQVFQDSRDAFNRGDFPIISLMDSFFGGSGHAVRPYKWDDTTDPNNWTIFIYNPNSPAFGSDTSDSADPNVISIDAVNNKFSFKFSSTDTWSGGEWTGGRMFYFPFRHLVDVPRTPFWEVLALIVGGTLILLGDTGQTQQITDGTGKTLFEPGLGGPPTRWDQYVQNPANRLPNLSRVPMTDSGSGPIPMEMFYGRSAGASYVHEVVPAAGVAAGTPYEWTLRTPKMSAHVVIPGTPGVPDVLTASGLHTTDRSVSVHVPVASGNKSIAWTMTAGVKQRWMELTNLKMSGGQAISTTMSNGGFEFTFNNSGPATTADLRVQAGTGLDPVVVGQITIPTGTSDPFKFDAPLTTLTAAPPTPNGNFGWYKTPVSISFSAQDYSSKGIAFTEYSKDGLVFTTYTGPFVLADEGVTTLFYRSKDLDGNLEDTRSKVFKIDTRPPLVTGIFDKAQYTRVDPITITYDASDPTPGSGLLPGSVVAVFDGTTLTSDPQTFPPLFLQAIGTTNTLTVSAEDVVGWVTSNSFSFQLVATLASIRATLIQLRALGEIDNDGVLRSLLADVDAAIAAEGRGQPNVARNDLSALLNELSAQRGKHVSNLAIQLLVGDIQYVQAHL